MTELIGSIEAPEAEAEHCLCQSTARRMSASWLADHLPNANLQIVDAEFSHFLNAGGPMYAVINYLSFKGPIEAALIEKVDQDLKPKLLAYPGLQAFYLVRVAEDQAIIIVLYDSLSAQEEGTRTVGSPWFAANVAPHLSAPPQRSVGEVVVEARK